MKKLLIKQYKDEADLSFAVQLAYYYASEKYALLQKVDSGKGYADIIFIPYIPDKPIIMVELKYEKSTETGVSQIKNQNYPQRLELYKNNMLSISFNYDKNDENNNIDFKHHTCTIEEYKKDNNN